jgi:hypothetical protein
MSTAISLGPWIGYGLALFAAAAIVWAAWGLGEGTSPRRLNLLLAIAGGLIGWVVGILITPLSPGEQTQFSDYGKALSTFVTGYLVAKLDRLFDISIKETASVNEVFLARIMIFASAFALGALSTYVWRAYVSH